MNKIDSLDFESVTFNNISETELKNLHSTLNKFTRESSLHEDLLTSYKTFIRSFEKKIKDIELPILQMFFICFREFLVSTQLMAQGHFSEGYTIISRASEAVGYSVVMKGDSKKSKIWIEFSGKKGFKKLFGEPFPKGNNLLHPTIFTIYNLTRQYGSHTNFSSTMHFTSKKADLNFEFVYCDFNDFKWMKRNLVWNLHSFTEFLLVFKSLFKDNLSSNWIKEFEIYVDKWINYKDANKLLFR